MAQLYSRHLLHSLNHDYGQRPPLRARRLLRSNSNTGKTHTPLHKEEELLNRYVTLQQPDQRTIKAILNYARGIGF